MTDTSESPTASAWVVSVKDLVEFILRRGGLSRGAFRSVRRAHEGSRGHRDVQRQRPPNYVAEVPVRHHLRTPCGQQITVQGRIDGVLQTATGWLLEEIKTVMKDWNGEPGELHWAQAKVYAALYLREHALTEIDIQLTYHHLQTNDLTVFRKSFPRDTLQSFYHHLLVAYRAWIELQAVHRRERDRSIRASSFPFSHPRAGQERLLWASGKALRHSHTLLAEAPTGIGKTIAVLYAGVVHLSRAHGRLSLVYLTAKTTGHESARKAVEDLARTGIRLSALAFAARDRLCFGPDDGSPCDVAHCPFAQSYYDHRQAALRDALHQGWVGWRELRALAERHRVCPSALATDLVPWVDLVVCDYNYVFDPSVRLARLSNGSHGQVALLIDEAHNLPDRARRMFSAQLGTSSLAKLKRALGTALPPCRQAIDKMIRVLRDAAQRQGVNLPALHLQSLPQGMRSSIGAFLAAADHFLSCGEPASYREELLETYFELTRFLRLLDLGNAETHTLLLEQLGPPARRHGLLRWLCLDPGPLLQSVYRETGPTIIFSATLSPAVYFQRLLGHATHPARLELSSPFPAPNFGLMVYPGIATTYRKRAASYDKVAEVLAAFALGKRGHYFAFFSSYDYLRQVEEHLRAAPRRGLRILSQSADMGITEREAFLKHFQRPPSPRTRTSLLGLAVLGGVFGEGVDLAGESLIGVAVVGVGLPQVNLENDLIKKRFSRLHDREDESRGFDFAYTYPGFNRVLQAVGRLIRSDTDLGMALLIDERYRRRRYRELFPAWWQPKTVGSIQDMAEVQEQFWRSHKR